MDAEIPGCPPRPAEILAAIGSGPDAIAAKGGRNHDTPIGPIHPGLKEPVRLKLETQGEKVISAEIDFGYVHRGIERVMTGKTWQRHISLRESVWNMFLYSHPDIRRDL